MVGLVRFLTLLSEVDPRRLQGVPHLTETGEVVGDEKLRAVEDGEHENPSWFSDRRGSFAVCGRRAGEGTRPCGGYRNGSFFS